MKTLTIRSLIAVAALAVAAASASAQTYKAEMPISFHISNKLLSAGTYQFRILNSDGQAQIAALNLATHESAVVLAYRGSDAPKAWRATAEPKLALECVGASCTLRRFWDGSSIAAYQLPARKVAGAEVDRASLVVINMTKGDE